MRHSWLGPLMVVLFAGVALADSPFVGTWRVTLPQPQIRSEVNLWLVKIDKTGKRIEVLAGASAAYKNADVKDIKAGEKELIFTLVVPKGDQFVIRLQPPTKDDKDLCRGCVRIVSPGGAGLGPIWFEKTVATVIDSKRALQKVGGLGDLEEAIAKMDVDDRLSALAAVTRTHLGRPVALLAHTQALNELARAKAKAPAFRTVLESYFETSQLFGPHLVFVNRLQVANALRVLPEAQEVAVENAQEAVKLLDETLPREQHLNAYLALANTLATVDKKDEADRLAVKMKELGDAFLADIAPEQKATAHLAMSGPFLQSSAPGVADLGLSYARAGHALLEKDAPGPRRLLFDRFLRNALMTRGLKEEASKLSARIDQLELDLDAEFEKTNIPFDIKKFTGRKGTSSRAVLVELFTGAQGPTNVAGDVAFEALRRRYPAKDVVVMQYHLHVPAADALTCPDGEARQRYYGKDIVGSVPTLLLDGKSKLEVGGTRTQAAERLDEVEKELSKRLDDEAGSAIGLNAKRDGDTVEIEAKVTGLKMPARTVRLRLALVEQEIRYPGASGQRLHRHVVRAFPGGLEGFALEAKESQHKARVDLQELRKSLGGALQAYQARTRVQFRDVPLALTKLRVIAFVQDDETKTVLQSRIVDVD